MIMWVRLRVSLSSLTLNIAGADCKCMYRCRQLFMSSLLYIRLLYSLDLEKDIVSLKTDAEARIYATILQSL